MCGQIRTIPGGQGCRGLHRPHVSSARPGSAAAARCWWGRRPWGARRHSGPPSNEVTGLPTPLLPPAQALFPGPRPRPRPRARAWRHWTQTESASSESPVSLCPPNSISWIKSTAHLPDFHPWPSLNITPASPSPSLSDHRHSFDTTVLLLPRLIVTNLDCLHLHAPKSAISPGPLLLESLIYRPPAHDASHCCLSTQPPISSPVQELASNGDEGTSNS